jgi:hypothetical protein
MVKSELNAKDIGLRLGIVVSKYKGGTVQAAASIGISKWTLERYVAGAENMPLLKVALICEAVNINITWLLYGD